MRPCSIHENVLGITDRATHLLVVRGRRTQPEMGIGAMMNGKSELSGRGTRAFRGIAGLDIGLLVSDVHL